MKKPVQQYMAVFVGRYEGAQMKLEAKSDQGAARIAASYELDSTRKFWCCDLVDLLKWNGQRWVGVSRALVERAQHFPQRRAA